MVDRALAKEVADGETGVTGADHDRRRAYGCIAQLTLTVTLVGLVITSNTADRFWDWATRASMSSCDGIGIDVVVHLDVVEAVPHLGIATEDAEDVHVTLDRRLDRVELDAPVLRHAATPAVRQLARPTRTNSTGVAPGPRKRTPRGDRH